MPQFIEQPRILDGDDGLGGEVLHQRNLFIGERPDFGAVDKNGADQHIVLEHRHGHRGSRASESSCRSGGEF
ncbi:MAG: hypothetical protein WAM72_25695, partial [Xanthobacteraceae bacterium]